MYQSKINRNEMMLHLSSHEIECSIDIEHLLDSLKSKTWRNQDLLSASSPQVMNLAVEYATLAATPVRSNLQNDRLAKILDAATQSEILDFWVTEIDHFVGHYLGLLDSNHREFYKDQQACLSEYLSQTLAKNPRFTNPVRSL